MEEGGFAFASKIAYHAISHHNPHPGIGSGEGPCGVRGLGKGVVEPYIHDTAAALGTPLPLPSSLPHHHGRVRTIQSA